MYCLAPYCFPCVHSIVSLIKWILFHFLLCLGCRCLALGRKLGFVRLQAFCNPASTRLDALAESHDIVLTGLLYSLELLRCFLKTGLAAGREFFLVLRYTFRYPSLALLNALAEFLDISRAGTGCLGDAPVPVNRIRPSATTNNVISGIVTVACFMPSPP